MIMQNSNFILSKKVPKLIYVGFRPAATMGVGSGSRGPFPGFSYMVQI